MKLTKNMSLVDYGKYIYFWPKEQFKAKSEDDKPGYVAGFSYFLAADRSAGGRRTGEAAGRAAAG